MPASALDFVSYLLIGFFAQWVNGSLGMGFGVITNTFLLSVVGMSPLRASAHVHVAEVFTTGASAISHIRHGNVDWKLFWRLTLPGVAGGAAGAYFLAMTTARCLDPSFCCICWRWGVC